MAAMQQAMSGLPYEVPMTCAGQPPAKEPKVRIRYACWLIRHMYMVLHAHNIPPQLKIQRPAQVHSLRDRIAAAQPLHHAHCIMQSRHFKLWIPMRCEAPGCTNQAHLSKCKQCTTVMYCSRECQKRHWPEHKVECAHLAKLGMWGQPYPVPVDDQTCPASAIDALQPETLQPQNDRCNCCGATGPLQTTECCGLKVCKYQPDQYELGSYSRDFCARSHERYSRCGDHDSTCCKDHAPADWRDCPRCMAQINAPEGTGVATLWRFQACALRRSLLEQRWRANLHGAAWPIVRECTGVHAQQARPCSPLLCCICVTLNGLS